jgi:hypothetical protein
VFKECLYLCSTAIRLLCDPGGDAGLAQALFHLFDLHLLAEKQAGRQRRLHVRLPQQVAWVFVQIHSLTLFHLHATAATQSRAPIDPSSGAKRERVGRRCTGIPSTTSGCDGLIVPESFVEISIGPLGISIQTRRTGRGSRHIIAAF